MNLRESTILRALAAAAGVFLVAASGSFAAGRSRLLIDVQTPVVANPAPDSVCQTILEASDKLFTTPYHMFSTQASDGVQNGKPMSSEMVSTGGAQYILYNGKWQASPMTIQEMKAMDERNRKNATNVSCHSVRDESVNGESATLYTMHSETPRSKNDDQIWISRSKGLILRQESDLISNTGNRKTHLSARYEYSNVQAPKL